MPRRLVAVFALACGAVVANLYYAQPLLAEIGRSLHVTGSSAGLVVTASQVGYAAGLLLLVPLGDIRDPRRLVLRLLTVAVVALAACALAPGLVAFAAAVLVVGVVSTAVQVLVPLAARLAGERERGRVVGTVMSGLLIGVLLSRTLSGLLAQVAGWRAVYAAAAVLTAGLILLLRRELPEVGPAASLSYRELLGSVLRLVARERALQVRCALGALGFAAFSVFWTTLALLLSRPPFRYGEAVIGLFGLAGAAGAAAASFAGRLADRGRAPLTTVAFSALMTGAFALLAVRAGHSLAALLAGVVVLDLGVQGLQVTNQSEIYRLAPHARSRVTTAYMTSYFAGGASGSALGVWAFARHGWAGVCLLGALLGAAALLIALGSWRLRAVGPGTVGPVQRDDPAGQVAPADPAPALGADQGR